MVTRVRPQKYDDVIHVGQFFRRDMAVVMDLSALPAAEALPLVDFAAGLVVGRGGSMERVAPRTFLLRPEARPAPAAG